MKLIKQGKVRDIYNMDDSHLLLVASDRLSAYDVIFPDPFPGKGAVLTELSRWWLDRVQSVVPTHWSPANDDLLKNLSETEWLEIEPQYRGDLAHRAMVVDKCSVIPFECIVRGYAFGSYLKDHPGVKPMTPFTTPLFTPTTKAETGHDEAVSFETMCEAIGSAADHLRDQSIELFRFAAEICLQAGIVLVDTKFEFGRDRNGEIRLIDECFTPDSSRFILKDDFDRGKYDSYDKQIVRDYVDQLGWDRKPPAPSLPPEVIEKTIERYQSIRARITGVLVA